MKSYQVFFFAKRFCVYSVMILLGLLAIVPIYVLMINATRSTEEINQGISLVPGKNAFFSSTVTVTAGWEDVIEVPAGEGQELTEQIRTGDFGTAKYLDLIPGTTLREETNKQTGEIERRVTKSFTESRQPRIAIVDGSGNTLATYVFSNNAQIFVMDGERVEKGKVIAKTVTMSTVGYNWRVLATRDPEFKIWRGFRNSAFISIGATILSVYFSAMTAYGLHVYRFRGRAVIWTTILIIMMLPGSLTFIGFYQFMVQLKLTNNYIPLIVPGIAAGATVLFIRQYMMSVLSMELVDAARIDGAGEYRIFNFIIIPIITPALAAQAIFTFVGSWNNFITPFVLLGKKELSTLPMLIQSLRGDIYRTEFGSIYLGIAVSLIPILVFYAFMSRFIISGLSMGGVKE